MKPLIRLIARMYPRRWRDRYAAELETLLADSNAGLREAPDLLKSALWMHIRMAGTPLAIALCCAVGVAAGYSLTFALPPVYWSESRMRLTGDSDKADNDQLFRAAQRALARRPLVAIIDDEDLYRGMRARLPMEDIVQQMRQDIRITSLPGREFGMSFRSDDERVSRRVVERLTARLVSEYTALEVMDYSVPKRVRPYQRELPLFGAAAGAALAAAWSIWRKLRPTSAPGHNPD